MFPNVPRRDHDESCVRVPGSYSCSCGMFDRALSSGDFVRYEVALGPKDGEVMLPIDKFLALCVSSAAAVDMVAFNKRA